MFSGVLPWPPYPSSLLKARKQTATIGQNQRRDVSRLDGVSHRDRPGEVRTAIKLHAAGLERQKKTRQSGQAFDGAALSVYLKAKVQGLKAKRPAPIKLTSIKSVQT